MRRSSPTRTAEVVKAEIRNTVEPGTQLYTDSFRSYRGLGTEYAHEVIDHACEYVRGNVHTNGVENFWSLLKRGLKGTYVAVEPPHLQRYVHEQVFRFNNRKDMNDGGRFKAVASQVVGKRITYAELTGKTGQVRH